MTCDISPSYCTLNKDEIKHVYEICPDSKIILFVRNPLDRAWSHIKMKLFRKEGYQDFSKIDNKVILDSISKEYLDIFSPYPIYNKWASVYPDKQIYVAYYEEMKDDRSLFLRNLFSFLELDVGEIKEVEKKSISKRNKSKFDEFPPEIKLHLSKLVAQHFEDATKFDSPYATEWMNSFKKTVETK
jgi:hypothetical protein